MCLRSPADSIIAALIFQREGLYLRAWRFQEKSFPVFRPETRASQNSGDDNEWI
jgi:hypothetical protein